MRDKKYKKTHPWITFKVNLGKIDSETWLLLGEAKSKCARVSNVPLKPSLSNLLYSTYMAKGVQGTTAIEGNTLSEEDVRKRIEGELELPDSMEYQGKEIDNVIEAFNDIAEKLRDGESQEISSEEIKSYNEIILKDLPLEEGVTPGQISQHNVGIFRYRGVPREDCEYLLDKMCEWLNSSQFNPDEEDEDKIIFAIIKAVLAHLYIAWIHPFGDGNGRTARLIELKIMLTSGAPAIVCHLLSNHYNKTRSEYYRQLDYASKSGGDIYKFIRYAVRGFVDQLQEQINFIDLQQLEIFWRDYIFETFGENLRASEKRRRNLALDFWGVVTPLKIEEIRGISPKMAGQYSRKSSRTIQRDIEFLVEENLVEEQQDGYLPKREALLKFLPRRIAPRKNRDPVAESG